MDNGFHKVTNQPKAGEALDRAFDPTSSVLRGVRLVASNDNRAPLNLRLKRAVLLLIAGGAAIWLFWTGLR
ncbi:MAG: hypothetical protein JWO51_1436 [Rhodospirillales bacterium]|nr:hypothetical protein [Rhodospirillales bacterium]